MLGNNMSVIPVKVVSYETVFSLKSMTGNSFSNPGLTSSAFLLYFVENVNLAEKVEQNLNV